MEVGQVKRGLACECRCPGCGESLLARKGEVKAQHFAHSSGAECATGAETSLHLAAKQLVKERLWIQLPPVEVTATRDDPQCGLFQAHKTFGAGGEWRFDDVVLEMTVGNIRPDAVGFAASVGHAVEIRVTHKVDEEKQSHLVSLGMPAIEVNLAPMVGKVFSFESLEAVVLRSTDNKTWLFHPSQAEWEALLLSDFEAWRKVRLAELFNASLHKAQSAPASPPSLKDVYQAANAKYRALTDSEKWTLLESQLGIARRMFPSHLRVALREGGDSVAANSELWQGALFAQFILGSPKRPTLGKRMPSDATLGIWLAQRFGVSGRTPDAPARAARSYLNYLKACGFLRWQAGGYLVTHDQVRPPAREPQRPPASPARTPDMRHAVKPVSVLRWNEIWPDSERLRDWADDLSDSGARFDAEWFVYWLQSLREPALLLDVQRAFGHAEGNSEHVVEVLRGLGVISDTWRHFSYGEPAPWLWARPHPSHG
jgi:hypothetical protein